MHKTVITKRKVIRNGRGFQNSRFRWIANPFAQSSTSFRPTRRLVLISHHLSADRLRPIRGLRGINALSNRQTKLSGDTEYGWIAMHAEQRTWKTL